MLDAHVERCKLNPKRRLDVAHGRQPPATLEERTCGKCARVFLKRYHLSRHAKHCVGRSLKVCPYCVKEFTRESAQACHARTCPQNPTPLKRTPETPLPCPFCARSVPTRAGLSSHVPHCPKNPAARLIRCRFCAAPFNLTEARRVHERKCLKNPECVGKFQVCPHCAGPFETGAGFAIHERRCLKNPANARAWFVTKTCPHCGKKKDSRPALRVHIRRCAKSPEARALATCERCGKVTKAHNRFKHAEHCKKRTPEQLAQMKDGKALPHARSTLFARAAPSKALRTVRCVRCSTLVEVKPTAARVKWCSPACRKKARAGTPLPPTRPIGSLFLPGVTLDALERQAPSPTRPASYLSPRGGAPIGSTWV